MSSFGEEDETPDYERKTLRDVQPSSRDPGDVRRLVDLCTKFSTAIGSDGNAHAQFESQFPRHTMPITPQFADDTLSFNTEGRLRMCIIVAWFLWKSCADLESWIWQNEEERKGKTGASSSCYRIWVLMERMLRDVGWGRLNHQQAEEKLTKYLRTLYSRASVLVKIDSESTGFLNPSV